MEKRGYYFACLDIRGKKCAVVGGGKVAERKTRSLLLCGGKVRVISPGIGKGIEKLARQGCVSHIRKPYSSKFLNGAALVIAATDNRKINAQVAKDANKRGILVNVVDDPVLSSFILPATLRRGELAVSVSTNGASPLFARWLKEEIGKIIGPEYAALLKLMKKARLLEKAGKKAKPVKERGYLW
ncbi:MAG: bifunctional precorrin-2 dehydrogenase/sirohydrochlorin ferrochelatase [Candidatus Omnitrophica bacterium]|nr:bifunctional precorrin-2 dehydrogenase/sirohydrochlorin ferrochelatase [Candidatus Omnitrophota bacterium]